MGSSDGSDKSRMVALALAILLGFAGGHRIYSGKIGTAVMMLLTAGGLGVWWVYDIILVASGEFRDARGKRITTWVADEALDHREPPAALTGEVIEEIEALRAEVMELAERVDFTERLLTRARHSAESDRPANTPV